MKLAVLLLSFVLMSGCIQTVRKASLSESELGVTALPVRFSIDGLNVAKKIFRGTDNLHLSGDCPKDGESIELFLDGTDQSAFWGSTRCEKNRWNIALECEHINLGLHAVFVVREEGEALGTVFDVQERERRYVVEGEVREL
jgi:hypothetical protein